MMKKIKEIFNRIWDNNIYVMGASILFALILAGVYTLVPNDIGLAICTFRGILVLLVSSVLLVRMTVYGKKGTLWLRNLSIFSVSLLWTGYLLFIVFKLEAVKFASSNTIFDWGTLGAIISIYLWSKGIGTQGHKQRKRIK